MKRKKSTKPSITLFLVHMQLFSENDAPKSTANVEIIKKRTLRSSIKQYDMSAHPYIFYAVVSTTSKDEVMAWLKATPGVFRRAGRLKNADPFLLEELSF